LKVGDGRKDEVGIVGLVIGRIFKANRFPNGTPWQWTLTYDENRSLTHGYEPTREAAMQAFARSWHREA
jgi:hypothetical protein